MIYIYEWLTVLIFISDNVSWLFISVHVCKEKYATVIKVVDTLIKPKAVNNWFASK